MTLPTFVAATSGGDDTSAANISVTRAGAASNGRVRLVALYREANTTVTATGWTQIGETVNTGSPNMYVTWFWHRDDGSAPASWTFSWSGSTWRGYVSAAYDNVVASGSPVEQYTGGTGNSATITGPTITTQGVDRKRVFGGIFFYGNSSSYQAPSVGTLRGNINSLAFLADEDRASAGATGTATIQVNNSESGRWAASCFGLIGVVAGGSQTITVTAGIASGEAFGGPTASPGAVAVAPAGLASAEAFGSLVLSMGGTIIAPTGLVSGEAFGSLALVPGAVDISPAGIAGGEAFGAVALGLEVSPTGMASAEAFGSQVVALGEVAPGSLQVYGDGNASNVGKLYFPCDVNDPTNVGQGDFTLEFWVIADPTNPDGSASAGANYSWINSPIMLDRDLIGDVGSGGDWGVCIAAGRVAFGLENSVGGQRTIVGSTDIRDGNWHHVAVTRVRSSGDMAVYVDGSREAFQAGGPGGDVHVASDAASSTYNPFVCLGGEKHALDWPQGQFIGYFAEFRISTTLRYTGTSYTVPTAPFAQDANTVGLWHLNDGSGTAIADVLGVSDGSFTVGASGPTWESLSPFNPIIAPTGITSGEAFGSAALVPGAVTVAPNGLASAEAFGSATLTPGAVSLLLTGLASAEAFGSPALVPGAVALFLSGLVSGESFGAAVVSAGGVLIAPAGISSGEAFGSAALVPGAVAIIPDGIGSAGAFGSHLVTAGGLIIAVTAGIASAEAFGNHSLVPGAVTISPAGVASGEAFGSPALGLYLVPTGLASGEAFGSLTLTPGVVVITPAGIASLESFGTMTIANILTAVIALTLRERGTALTLAARTLNLTLKTRS